MSTAPFKNCRNCAHLGSDDSGGDFSSYSWPVCNLEKTKANLKSFPFLKEQDCHAPEFWRYMDIDEELSDMWREESKESDFVHPIKTLARFREKYCQSAPTPSAKGES